MGTAEQTKETIGQRIRSARKRHGDSQEELAAKLHVARQAISKWETGKAKPDMMNLVRVSEIYGVSVTYLLDGKKEDAEEKNVEEGEKGIGEEGDSLESMEIWEDDEKLRKILLSCAGVVAMAILACMRVPPLGMIVCISVLIYSRKWKVNTKWLDGLTTVYLLLDAYRFYVFLNHWIVDFGRSTFHFYF